MHINIIQLKYSNIGRLFHPRPKEGNAKNLNIKTVIEFLLGPILGDNGRVAAT